MTRAHARRAMNALVEAVVAVAAAVLFASWCRTIDIDPMVRVGQVSGIAQVQFRFAVAAMLLVLGLALIQHRAPQTHELVMRVGCAAVAGLFTGMVAGGVGVALTETPYGLWAGGGDYRWILDWIGDRAAGLDTPGYYPPAIFWLIEGWAGLSGQPPVYAIKEIQIVGTALFGPAAYLAWRLLLPPVWALAIGVVAMIPFIEPVKPYPQITLIVLVPVLLRFLQLVRRSGALTPGKAALRGGGYGAALGALFLLYSGWFVWCAAGLVAAFAIVVPKRRAWPAVFALAGGAILTFVAVSWVHLVGLLTERGGADDRFFYFDTNTEPGYFAMWRNDRGAGVGIWPPLGELGGVGLFTIVLVLGVGVALWLGWRRTVVIGVGLFAVSAWIMRMWLAGQSYDTMTVRLYPRTTAVILYATLILTGYAVYYAARAAATVAAGLPRPPIAVALIPVLFLLALAGSATVDRYMPGSQGTFGDFARFAHEQPMLDGRCPKYGAGRVCDGGSPFSTLEPVWRHPSPAPSPAPAPSPSQ